MNADIPLLVTLRYGDGSRNQKWFLTALDAVSYIRQIVNPTTSVEIHAGT